jgi:hypothetical protein
LTVRFRPGSPLFHQQLTVTGPQGWLPNLLLIPEQLFPTFHHLPQKYNQPMSLTLLAGLCGVIAVSAGIVWFALKSSRKPYEDHVSTSELNRINNDYRNNS